MKQGYLSEYFKGIAAKRLSEVEINPGKSHQHEFNGARKLLELFGEPSSLDGKQRMETTFIYLTDDEDNDPVSDKSLLTWYDARKKAREERQVMRWEYRLYYRDNIVIHCATPGDLLLLAQKNDGTLLALIIEQGSTIEQQIIWLFGLANLGGGEFSVRPDLNSSQDQIGFAARFILEQIGIGTISHNEDYLQDMLDRFGGVFPSTAEFSSYARSTLRGIYPRDDVDGTLMMWMEREEMLFRSLEKHLLQVQLEALIRSGIDTDAFINTAKSALQRRKARAGAALENHLQHIFDELRIKYCRGCVTESRLKPDFIFPSINDYHCPGFPPNKLDMLAVKTTCKDRWRQILNEAARIPCKHLFTLEPGISESQTDEMQQENVRLVLPRELHESYTEQQQVWLMSLHEFIGKISIKQVG